MTDDLFAEVKSEGQSLDIDKAFERLETKEDKPAPESQTEKKETDKASQEGANTSAEKPEPFHKHPRWIKTQSDLREAREKLEKLEKERSQNQPITLPDWWKAQHGETDESKQRYEAVLKGELPWLKDEILKEIEQKTQADQNQIKQGEEYVDTQIQEMTDEGLKFERNALLKFMVDFQEEFGAGALLNAQGDYDFRKSLTLMEKMQPAAEDTSSTIKKQLASQGVRGKASTQRQSTVPVLSRQALRRGNWRDADTGQFTSTNS